MSYVLAYAVSVALTGGLLWARGEVVGLRPPHSRTSSSWCCSAAVSRCCPRAGLVLGMAIMALLLLRTTEADVWPEPCSWWPGSGVIWVVVYVTLFTLSF